MALVYHLPLQEGSGTTVTDVVTATELTAQEASLDWQTADIKGYTDLHYIQSGSVNGIIEGSWFDDDLPVYSFSLLTQITAANVTGAVLRNLNNNLHFRYESNAWCIDGGNPDLGSISNPNGLNVWARITFIQSLTGRQIYIDDVLANSDSQVSNANGTLTLAGSVRIGSFNNNGFFYPGDYTDLRVYDTALTSTEIEALVAFDDDPNPPVIEPTGIASDEAFGTPSVLVALELLPNGIPSDEAFGLASISLSIGVTGIPSDEAFGTPVVITALELQPNGIPSGEAFGSPTITIDISPEGIISAEAFGTPAVSIDINPAGIESAEAFGSIIITGGATGIVGPVNVVFTNPVIVGGITTQTIVAKVTNT